MNIISHLALARTKASERKNAIRLHADRIAAERDTWVRKNAAYYDEDRRYMRFLIPAGARVLDLGCGTGDLLAALEPSLGVGVDLSPAMIDRARSKHPHLTFHVGDAEDDAFLATIEGPFDYIVLSDTIGLSTTSRLRSAACIGCARRNPSRDCLLFADLGTGAMGCHPNQDADASAAGKLYFQYRFSQHSGSVGF